MQTNTLELVSEQDEQSEEQELESLLIEVIDAHLLPILRASFAAHD